MIGQSTLKNLVLFYHCKSFRIRIILAPLCTFLCEKRLPHKRLHCSIFDRASSTTCKLPTWARQQSHLCVAVKKARSGWQMTSATNAYLGDWKWASHPLRCFTIAPREEILHFLNNAWSLRVPNAPLWINNFLQGFCSNSLLPTARNARRSAQLGVWSLRLRQGRLHFAPGVDSSHPSRARPPGSVARLQGVRGGRRRESELDVQCETIVALPFVMSLNRCLRGSGCITRDVREAGTNLFVVGSCFFFTNVSAPQP